MKEDIKKMLEDILPIVTVARFPNNLYGCSHHWSSGCAFGKGLS